MITLCLSLRVCVCLCIYVCIIIFKCDVPDGWVNVTSKSLHMYMLFFLVCFSTYFVRGYCCRDFLFLSLALCALVKIYHSTDKWTAWGGQEGSGRTDRRATLRILGMELFCILSWVISIPEDFKVALHKGSSFTSPPLWIFLVFSLGIIDPSHVHLMLPLVRANTSLHVVGFEDSSFCLPLPIGLWTIWKKG